MSGDAKTCNVCLWHNDAMKRMVILTDELVVLNERLRKLQEPISPQELKWFFYLRNIAISLAGLAITVASVVWLLGS